MTVNESVLRERLSQSMRSACRFRLWGARASRAVADALAYHFGITQDISARRRNVHAKRMRSKSTRQARRLLYTYAQHACACGRRR
jgi:hypothetical protein